MELIAVTVLGAFLLVGLFVGAWLVRLSLRTGKQPELLVAFRSWASARWVSLPS